MKNIITKLILIVITIFLSLSIYTISKINVTATEEIEYIKISVDDYYGNESNYLKNENKRYIVCGIIDTIYLSYKNEGIHGFDLKSFNPLSNNVVRIYCKVDPISYDNKTTYSGHYVYSGSLSNESGKGKYIEILLDEDAYKEIITDSSLSRGYVNCDATNANNVKNSYLNSYINGYKSNKVLSSMRFNYDFTPSISDSSTSTWTLIQARNEITNEGTYALGKLYDNGNSIKFVTTSKSGYILGDEFDYSISRVNDNSFTIVYPNESPAEFKFIKHEADYNYDVKVDGQTINTNGTYNISSKLWLSTSNGEIISLEDETDECVLYIFKKTETGSDKNIHIEYYPDSVALKFLSYVDANAIDSIVNDNTLINSLTFGMVLSIEGKEDQYIDFAESEIARVESAGSNTSVTVDGFYQTILKVTKIPKEFWNTEITVTPYIKISLDSYTSPTDPLLTFDFEDTYFYQESVTKTICSLAEDYYLNHGNETGVSYHLIALKEIAELTAKAKEDK